MTKLIIDSSAWIEYLRGTLAAEIMNNYFQKKDELFTTGVCVAEIIAKVSREGLSSDTAFEAIRSLSSIIPIDLMLGKEGGELYATLRKVKPKIALSDALSIAAARRISAKIVTFDNDFAAIPEAILLKK